MEQLDYLIRTLTYKRSSLELDLKNTQMSELNSTITHGTIRGLTLAINEIYKLLGEMSSDSMNKTIEFMEKGTWEYGKTEE